MLDIGWNFDIFQTSKLIEILTFGKHQSCLKCQHLSNIQILWYVNMFLNFGHLFEMFTFVKHRNWLKCWHLSNIKIVWNVNIQGRKGQLAEGFDADLVIFAPEETQLVRWMQTFCMCPEREKKWKTPKDSNFLFILCHIYQVDMYQDKLPQVEVGDIQHKNKLTPYLGRKLRGVVYRLKHLVLKGHT